MFFAIAGLFISAALARAGEERAEMRAVKAATPIVVDGVLDEEIWENAPAYPMNPAPGRSSPIPFAGGTLRFAWDDEHLYFAAELEDDNILAYKDADGEHHYAFGDVIELFVAPADKTWYWELYATPLGRQTVMFLQRTEDMPPDSFPRITILEDVRMDVAVKVDGTVNDLGDKDKGWIVEMAVPVSELTKMGDAWGPGSEWTILVGRYDYSRYFDERGEQDAQFELSSAPALSRMSFHLKDEYARLVFEE